MMSRTRLSATGLPLILLAVLTGCSSASGGSASQTAGTSGPSTASASTDAQSPTASPQPPEAATAALTIRIKNFMYAVPSSVKAGSALTVINDDNQAHTVTLQGGSKVTVPGGSTAQLKAPSKPGSYPVTCDFHGNMHATLVVS
jgi:plastocyanin